MKIDYICYSVPSLSETDYTIAADDDENTVWIKTTDYAQMQKAIKNNLLLVFNREDKKFYFDGKAISVKGKAILPKAILPHERELLEALDNNGANNLMSVKDRQKVARWAKYIQPKHRKAIITTFGDFMKNCEKYRQEFNTIFLKTVEKSNVHVIFQSFGHIELEGQQFFYSKPRIYSLNHDDEVYISEAYDNVADKENECSCKEYRAFVIDGIVASLSRSYVDYSTKVPKGVVEFANEFVKSNANKDFPRNYVLDIGEIKMGDNIMIDIIECNAISASGLEVDNDVVQAIMDINAQNELDKKSPNLQ